jgi:hypothetical protein
VLVEKSVPRILSLSQTLSGWQLIENRAMLSCDEGPLQAHGWMVVDLIRSRAALWTLRQQINVLRRTAPKNFVFSALTV